MRVRTLSETVSRFRVGQKVKVEWAFDRYASVKDAVVYPKRGIIAHITSRGLFIQAPSGVISMVGIYNLATGTKVERVA